jgi:hypothetical protein
VKDPDVASPKIRRLPSPPTITIAITDRAPLHCLFAPDSSDGLKGLENVATVSSLVRKEYTVQMARVSCVSVELTLGAMNKSSRGAL